MCWAGMCLRLCSSSGWSVEFTPVVQLCGQQCVEWLVLPDVTQAGAGVGILAPPFTSCCLPDWLPMHLCSLQVRETQKTIRDGRTGMESMTIARGLGEQVRLLAVWG